MSETLPYDVWILDSLRMVVRRALDLAVREGLPGDHHYYLSFRTGAPGVQIPGPLRARYPDEMTIVLQHQFWDLEVDDKAFSVTLKFQGRSSRLHVPFAALTAFSDPSVKFGLQFKTLDAAQMPAPASDPEADAKEPAAADAPAEAGPAPAKKGEVVALDNFRRKS